MATNALFTATIAEMTATAVRAAALRILQDFPGCFAFAVKPRLRDVIESLVANEFREVLIVSHHGDRLRFG